MKHEISVQRHPLKIRKITVVKKTSVSPEMLRVKFQSDELDDFISMAPDDHVKAFFPDPSTGELKKPIPPGPGEKKPDENPSLMRDYTPLRFDTQKGELEIDFFIHGKGVGSEWAVKANVGDWIYIGGPRASYVVPPDFDWYLMIGDECSIPSVERRLRELPKNAKALVFLEVSNIANRRDWGENGTSTQVTWINHALSTAYDDSPIAHNARDLHDALVNALMKAQFPSGDFHTWIAMESSRAQMIKKLIIQEKGANSSWIKASGYWKKNEPQS